MQVILTALHDALAEAWRRFCGELEFVSVHQGSILDVPCDAVVSPANSFGFMDGGIDAVYRRYFADDQQRRVQEMIRERHHGELVVGTADLVATNDAGIPYLVVAPTMRVPMKLVDSVNGQPEYVCPPGAGGDGGCTARAVFTATIVGGSERAAPVVVYGQAAAFAGVIQMLLFAGWRQGIIAFVFSASSASQR